MTRIRTTIIGALIMASAAIAIGFTQGALALLANWQRAPERVATALDEGVTQVLIEVESWVKVNAFEGQASPGGGKVGTRSGALRQDITSERGGGLDGTVGTTERTASYARSILGPDATTITPKKSKKLWVPIVDNLNPSGIARWSPRALFDSFDRDRIKIVTSKAGNQVVLLEDRDADGNRQVRKRDGRGKNAARKKGETKAKLLFVLKDRVVLQGTDALAIAVKAFGADRGREILEEKLRGALL